MKNILKYSSLFLITIISFSCAKKISNPAIDRLESKKDLLEMSTDLNDLKLELQKEMVRNEDLTKEVEDVNKQASKSADDAKDLSNRLSRNPGDQSLARKAENAAKTASKDAKKARNLNNDLTKSSDKISELQNKISRLEPKVEDLKSKDETLEEKNN